MSNDVIKTEQIGDYRISICRDDYPSCPCKDWDMLGVHLFNSGSRLSEASNYEEIFYSNDHSLADAVCELACKYVPQKKFIEYINKYCDSLRFRYDRSDHMWYLEQYFKTIEHNGSHVPPLMRSPHHGNCIPQDTQGGNIHSRLFASTDLPRQHQPV